MLVGPPPRGPFILLVMTPCLSQVTSRTSPRMLFQAMMVTAPRPKDHFYNLMAIVILAVMVCVAVGSPVLSIATATLILVTPTMMLFGLAMMPAPAMISTSSPMHSSKSRGRLNLKIRCATFVAVAPLDPAIIAISSLVPIVSDGSGTRGSCAKCAKTATVTSSMQMTMLQPMAAARPLSHQAHPPLRPLTPPEQFVGR